jgi:uncharacterized protein involved in cysteine biosynthesis
MLAAAADAVTDMLAPPLRAVLMKSIALALAVIVVIGILLHRVIAALAEGGASWAEQATGMVPHTAWSVLLWVLTIMTSLGIITGALFLMPAVTAFIGSFFIDEVADVVERARYPAEPPGRALPLTLAISEGIVFALLSVAVYLVALPFVLFAGFGVLVLFFANAYLLGRQYFEFAAMRFWPPYDAKAMRRANAGYIFLAGMVIAAFVSIPVVNLATPIFAMAFMVHIHKRLTGKRVTLIEPAR